MKNISKAFPIFFLLLSISFSFVTSAFSFYEYKDNEGNHISFEFLSKESSVEDDEGKIYLLSFTDNYKDIPPQQINSQFKDQKDVVEWLKETWKEEWDHFKKKPSVKLINIFKNKELIGLAIIELWENKTTIHIRQMSILPAHQRHGYGAALINSIKKLPDTQVNRIIADVRKLNKKAQQFYKKLNFQKLEIPHDPDLRNTGKYLGLEWNISQTSKIIGE